MNGSLLKFAPFGAFWETFDPALAEYASDEDHSEWVICQENQHASMERCARSEIWGLAHRFLLTESLSVPFPILSIAERGEVEREARLGLSEDFEDLILSISLAGNPTSPV